MNLFCDYCYFSFSVSVSFSLSLDLCYVYVYVSLLLAIGAALVLKQRPAGNNVFLEVVVVIKERKKSGEKRGPKPDI